MEALVWEVVTLLVMLAGLSMILGQRRGLLGYLRWIRRSLILAAIVVAVVWAWERYDLTIWGIAKGLGRTARMAVASLLDW